MRLPQGKQKWARAAVCVCAVAIVAWVAAGEYGRHRAEATGYPDLSKVTDAEIIVFWDGAEYDEELEDADFDALTRVVARLDASGDRVATADLDSTTGDTPPMFRLTLEGGRRVRINVKGYEGRIIVDSDSWQANRDALNDLGDLYDLYYYRYLLPVALEAEGAEA